MSAQPKPDEKSMVLAAQQGDEAAHQALYKESIPKLKRAAMYFLGRNDADIEDIIQETWIIASAKIQEFEFRASIFTWLNHICVNLCYKRIRKLGREIARDEQELDVLTRQLAKERFEIKDEDEVKDGQRRILKEVMKDMGPNCQQTIRWRDFEGLSYGEMCSRTGLTIGAIHARVSRCRKKLKTQVMVYMDKQTED